MNLFIKYVQHSAFWDPSRILLPALPLCLGGATLEVWPMSGEFDGLCETLLSSDLFLFLPQQPAMFQPVAAPSAWVAVKIRWSRATSWPVIDQDHGQKRNLCVCFKATEICCCYSHISWLVLIDTWSCVQHPPGSLLLLPWPQHLLPKDRKKILLFIFIPKLNIVPFTW